MDKCEFFQLLQKALNKSKIIFIEISICVSHSFYSFPPPTEIHTT